MLDLRFIRANPDLVKEGARRKRASVDIDELLEADREALALRQQVERLRAQQGEVSRSVPKASGDERATLIAEGRRLGDEVRALEGPLKELDQKVESILLRVPNVPSVDVPDGVNEDDNVPVKHVGTPRAFDFTPLDHVALMEKHDLVELERGARVAGHRGYFLKREAALLEMAVMRFALDRLWERGFVPMTAPSFARTSAFTATGHFPGSEEETYHLERDDLWLSGTAEVPLTSMYAGEILQASQLPILYAAYSPCFRREAGSYGRDLKGIFRVHQFNKVEQFVICAADEAESIKWHETLLANAESLMQALELPYRVVNCCGGELGLGHRKRYDVEAWVPSEGRYRETQSCSYYLEYQARRANLRYRDAAGTVRHVHTLNNTALATPRLLMPLLENHQQADGSIRIPDALRPYLNGMAEIRRA
ncbi:MAG: serine--tRNA ligase [Chloroflexota bacterium]|mgnify:FL=1|jgi:seryl-tRNA synthetase|nr:serine--tRNA ligase [Pseudomonadota bacterium]